MTRRGFRQIATLPASPGGAEVVEVEVGGASYQVPKSSIGGASYRKQTAFQCTLSQPVGAAAFTDDTGKVVTTTGSVAGVADGDVPGGLCAEFSGAGGQLSIAYSTDFETPDIPFSIEGWFKTTQTGQQYCCFCERDSGAFANRSFSLLMHIDSASDGRIGFYQADYGGFCVKTVNGGYNDGVRHHVYVAFFGWMGELWIDGVRQGVSAIASHSYALGNNTATVKLGNSVLANRKFIGRMDNWRMIRGPQLPYTVSPFVVPTPPFPTV